jgi:hypothetical protein
LSYAFTLRLSVEVLSFPYLKDLNESGTQGLGGWGRTLLTVAH